MQDAAPVSYQDNDGRRVPVESRYVLRDTSDPRRVAFEVGQYDRSRPSIIDPALTSNRRGASHPTASER